MAYSATGLNAAGGQSKAGTAPQMWTYTTTDAIADVNTAGYFNSAASLLKVSDIIFCYTSSGGTPAMSIVWVNSNTGSVVDVTDGLTVTATDTD
jgi:hypothetical protein